MATVTTLTYSAKQTITIGLATTPLASSPGFVLGRSSAVIANTSNYIDAIVGGKVTVGTTPTTATSILVYAWGVLDNTPTYFDTLTGSDADITLTSAGVRDSFIKLAATANVDSATSNRGYFFNFSVAQLFGGVIPPSWGLWVTHNTGVALNATAGNHAFSYYGATYTNT